MTSPPFDASDADLLLHTPDGTTFRVYSHILAVASPVFHDMVQLSKPDADQDASMAVVDVTESGEVMDILLKFIYPIEEPPIETLSLISDVLIAAIKYEMKSVSQRLGRLLIIPPKFVEKEPIRVYAIACRHGIDEAAKVASSYTLRTNILHAPLPAELKFITAYDYSRLIALHGTRGQAAQELIVWESGDGCPGCNISRYNSFRRPSPSCLPPPLWWNGWSARAKAELLVRPSTDVIFSLSFLAQFRETCDSCSFRITDCHGFLAGLKKQIDDLPNTI